MLKNAKEKKQLLVLFLIYRNSNIILIQNIVIVAIKQVQL